MKLIRVGLMVLSGFASGAQAAKPVFVETYDLTQPTRCDGMTLDGIDYTFTVAGVPSDDCLAGTSMGPGISKNISPPNMEGTAAGVIHLTFSEPTTRFNFGVSEESHSAQPNSVVVNLYRPGIGMLRREVTLSTAPDPSFVGGRFTYEGPVIKTATIQFTGATTGQFNRFALDNMTYFRSASPVKLK